MKEYMDWAIYFRGGEIKLFQISIFVFVVDSFSGE